MLLPLDKSMLMITIYVYFTLKKSKHISLHYVEFRASCIKHKQTKETICKKHTIYVI